MEKDWDSPSIASLALLESVILHFGQAWLCNIVFQQTLTQFLLEVRAHAIHSVLATYHSAKKRW